MEFWMEQDKIMKSTSVTGSVYYYLYGTLFFLWVIELIY